jgi:hypothetical protein
VAPLTVPFQYQGLDGAGKAHQAAVVSYTAPSGDRVFSTGLALLQLGLDNCYRHGGAPPDARLQQFMRNALADLTAKR